jgi:phage-related protein
MPSIGPGCREIRIRVEGDAYRVVYVASIGDAVYVLHAFQKRTQRTAGADLDLAKKRYKRVTEMTRAKEI